MTDLLARLIAAGTPADLVGEVAMLIADAKHLDERRAKDRARKDKQREAEKLAEEEALSRDFRGKAVTSSSREGARAEPKTNNSSVPPQETKKEKQQEARDARVTVLATVLDADRAQAVVDHRQRMGKRLHLTPHSAGLLAKKFARCPDPNVAADAMISNGWQGFEPEWLQGKQSTGPPGQPRQASNGLAAYARKRFGLDGNRNGTSSRPAPEPPQHSGPTLDLGPAPVPEPKLARPALGPPQPRPGGPTRQ